jgi:hypothetical protein
MNGLRATWPGLAVDLATAPTFLLGRPDSPASIDLGIRCTAAGFELGLVFLRAVQLGHRCEINLALDVAVQDLVADLRDMLLAHTAEPVAKALRRQACRDGSLRLVVDNDVHPVVQMARAE